MNRQAVIRSLFCVIMMLGFSTVVEAGQGQSRTTNEQLFLQKSAEGQQLEIALGRLAAEKASNDQVKEFGRRMIEDHQKVNREILQLASREGIHISPELTDHQKQMQRTLRGLSGTTFDQAYMSHMLRDHVKDVKAFEQSAEMLTDSKVKAWASNTLAVLKEHLQRAKAVASAIGMMDTL